MGCGHETHPHVGPHGHGRAVDEQLRFLRTGIDGLLTDQPDIGVAARGAFLGQR